MVILAIDSDKLYNSDEKAKLTLMCKPFFSATVFGNYRDKIWNQTSTRSNYINTAKNKFKYLDGRVVESERHSCISTGGNYYNQTTNRNYITAETYFPLSAYELGISGYEIEGPTYTEVFKTPTHRYAYANAEYKIRSVNSSYYDGGDQYYVTSSGELKWQNGDGSNGYYYKTRSLCAFCIS